MTTKFRIKRIYDEPVQADGYRILVDRLWPRGVSKSAAKVDLWLKDFAPSTELRKWFHTDAGDFDTFVTKYQRELKAQQTEIEQTVAEMMTQPTITLLTAVKDPEHSHVPVLEEFLTNLISNG
tara:strand:+ start:27738 stop:28106 length:369 start_codon:yes stop_codon:yes gene_type:complete